MHNVNCYNVGIGPFCYEFIILCYGCCMHEGRCYYVDVYGHMMHNVTYNLIILSYGGLMYAKEHVYDMTL